MNNSLNKDKSKRIAYLVPNLEISGGIAIVLNHANRLLERGYKNVFILTTKNNSEPKWFNNKVPVLSLKDQSNDFLKEIDLAIATHWTTAPVLAKLPARRKMYFVQSDERRFFPLDDLINEVQRTYEMKFEYMTEAIWIQKWLKDEFGHDAYYVPNGLDSDVFYKTEPVLAKRKKPRVLIEGNINVWFKGMQDSYNAIKDLDCEIWIVSSNGKPNLSWRYDAFFDSVPIEEMKKMYSSCDIFLKMSQIEGFFGPPLEAMSCGCAVVVAKVSGYDEYIKNNENALVVEKRDVQVAKKAVKKLLENKELREKLVSEGFKTAKEWNWDRSIDFLEKAVNNEPVKVFYKNNFPEKYDFKSEIKQIKENYNKTLTGIFDSKEEIEKLTQLIKEKEHQIKYMEDSKFWKLRNLYLSIKRGIKPIYKN